MEQSLIARLKRISPERAGVVASLAILVVLAVVSLVYAGSVNARRAETAKATASHETPEQIAARDAAAMAVVVADEAQPVEAAPKPADAAVTPAPRATAGQQGVAFIDRFQGSALDERWTASDGWSNGDWTSNDWRASQIGFTGEGMRITLEKAPEGSDKPLMGGEIRTNESYRYGYFETRMRMPRDPGIVMGFFTYVGQDGKMRPNEIDIEILGRDTRTIELTLHQGGGSTGKTVPLKFDAADGFHTYGFEWRPDAVRWYADGKLIHQETSGRALKIDRAQQMLISLWGSKELDAWVGKLDVEKGPWRLDVSCAAYAPSYQGRQLCAD
jgi:endo-1,3-1,4-beta-glycanase ExoK